MKVYLVHTEDFKHEDFENVLNLLNSQAGTIAFLNGGTLELGDSDEFKTFRSKTIFEHQEQVLYSYSLTEASDNSYERKSFPIKKKIYTWKQLLQSVDIYKFENQINEDDFVFLLTNQYNEKNWFAFLGPSLRTGFIHTDDWPWFFGNNTDIRYPIAYEVASWLLRGLMYNNQKEIVAGFHKKTSGCINDFCKNKKEITIKMRTADICDDCMQIIKNKDIKKHYLNQLFGIFDGIRANLMFRKRLEFSNNESRIKIDLELKKIFLIDFGNLDIRLNPKELSLYLLFIHHSEGIALNSLIDYEEELFGYYKKISGRFNHLEMKNTIQLLINYLDGELHTTISRIKSKFKKSLGEEIASNYYIQQLPSGIHGIPINREGVLYDF